VLIPLVFIAADKSANKPRRKGGIFMKKAS